MAKPHPLKCKQWDFRDVSHFVKILREFLIGRQLLNRARYMPNIATRTIPAPNIPRGQDQYSNFSYHTRSPAKFVRPPVVAPIAMGPAIPGSREPLPPNRLAFSRPPAPGHPFSWDGHCYYECVEEYPPRQYPPRDNKCY